jgi:hypothetical protein
MATSPRITEHSDSSLLVAAQRVRAYTERDALMERRAQAMEGRECEDLLQCAVEAFNRLKGADETLREAAKAGFDVGEEVKEAIDSLYRTWLAPRERAERRIRECRERGFSIENLDQFRAASRFVERRVQKQDMFAALDEASRGDA